MSDFDFDELDKAVNSFAAKVDEAQPSPSAPPAQPQLANPPVQSPESSASATLSKPQVPQIKHPSRLSNGQPSSSRRNFMDIMPPAPRKPHSRVGATIKPAGKPEDIVPEKPAAAIPQASPAPVETPDDLPMVISPQKPLAAPQAEPAKPADNFTWPDPLDFHGTQLAPAAEEPPKPTKEPAAPEAEPPTADNTFSPTPFLAEARVEKRPLGAYSHFQSAPAESTQPSSEKPVTPLAVTDELTPDKEGTFTEPESPAEPEPSPETTKPVVEPAQLSTPDMHSAAMMSIPKQYYTAEKPADKTTRSIFDTKEYHPPLLEAAIHERHGSSMWTKLFIALVVVLLLAVAGYFVYLYLTQR